MVVSQGLLVCNTAAHLLSSIKRRESCQVSLQWLKTKIKKRNLLQPASIQKLKKFHITILCRLFYMQIPQAVIIYFKLQTTPISY